VRFHLAWPEDAEPAWHADALLAREVAAPALAAQGADIVFWRFHRRAARDAHGHRFSVLLYASPATAERVHAALAASPLLESLLAAGVVRKVERDDPARVDRPDPGDASDRHWSPALKRAWPHFIMGASALWLALLDEVAREREPPSPSPEALLAFYARLEEALRSTWRTEGRHALLHHLNALFAYQPLVLGDGRDMSF